MQQFHQRYRECFKTRTRDASPKAFYYLSALLRMNRERTFAHIERSTEAAEQSIHHFMSNSPWSAQAVLRQVRQEIAATPEFQAGGYLLLDESADEKASGKSIGAGKQHNGRLGKIETSQVGTFLAFVKGESWSWIDGELFLPQAWFSKPKAAARKKLGVPSHKQFATKIALGWQMIARVQEEGFPFEAVGCDTLYGRSLWLRRQMAKVGITYMADVPADTQVYMRCPQYGLPESTPGRKPFTKPRVLSPEPAREVRDLITQLAFARVRVRAVERGFLEDEFACVRVWVAKAGYEPQPETLLVRRDGTGKLHYALTNAAEGTPIENLAQMKCSRHFIERANQDAKSELGWDELRAQNYLAWEHQLALTIMASWFVAQTQHEWRLKYQRDERLNEELGMDALPRLSMANVREMLRAAMPVPQLTPEEATNLVVRHLVNRARSRKSRIKYGHY